MSAAPIGRCLNCYALLDGRFCGQCGQRAQDPDPTLRELLEEAWEAFVSIDGKFFSSLRLLVLRPGVLTAEYLRGHRVRHLAPLRLYLLCSVGYFLVSSIVPDRGSARATVRFPGADTLVLAERKADLRDSVERIVRRDSASRVLLERHGITTVAPGALDAATRSAADSLRAFEQAEQMTAAPAWVRHRLALGIQHVMRDKKNFGSDYTAQVPRLLFVLMPAFGLLLALAYRSRKWRYPAHLIVALHLHAFVFAVLTIDEVRSLIPWPPLRTGLKIVTAMWLVGYVPLALRRVYGGRLRYAIARTLVLGGAYSLVGLLAFSILAFALLLAY